MKRFLVIFLALLSILYAEDKIDNKVDLGYTSTSGNTDSKNFAFKEESNYKAGLHEFRFKGAFLYGRSEDQSSGEVSTDTNQWNYEANYDYFLTDQISFNFLSGGEGDRFATYKYQFYNGPGARWKFIDNDTQKLSVQSNVLYTFEKRNAINNDAEYIPEDKDNYFAYQLSTEYSYKIFENLTFFQYFSYRTNLEDFNDFGLKSDTKFENKITDMLAFGVNYIVEYTNDTDAEYKADRTFIASLIIDF